MLLFGFVCVGSCLVFFKKGAQLASVFSTQTQSSQPALGFNKPNEFAC